MKISSVYIVKNEENNIEKSINSIKDVCDEIIVVDTGSTDKTIQKCRDLGCQVYNYEWVNDFSKARNYAISLCSNEIIIFLDADEYFTQPLSMKDKDIILNYFTKDIDTIGCFETDIEKSTGEEHLTQYVYKIFRNNLRFKGTIHEFLFVDNRDLKVLLAQDFQLIHTGYSAEISRSKVERNLQILNLIEDPEAMDYYYLGRENLSLGNIEKADLYFNLFFKDKKFKYYINNNNLAYLAYIYKYRTMNNLPNIYSRQDILNMLLQAQKHIPHIPEIYFCLGEYYFEEDLQQSIDYFDKCIKINENFIQNHFELNNFLGYQDKIYYYKAKALDLMSKKNEAIQRAIVSCMLDKKSQSNLGCLLHLLNRNKIEKNIDLLNRIYKPNSKQDYEFLVRALENTNLYAEFLNFALIYNQEFQGGADSLYYAMMLNQNFDEALQSLKHFDNNKKNFIMSVILLYANNVTLMQEYFDYLSQDYIDILQVLILRDFNIKINFEILTNIICKLITYGADIPLEIMQYIVQNCSDEQINQIINIYLNQHDYYKAEALTSYYLQDLNKFSVAIATQHLFILFKLHRYEEFIEQYNNLMQYEVNLHKNNLALLRLISNKQVSKKYKLLKNKIEKEAKAYAKGKS